MHDDVDYRNKKTIIQAVAGSGKTTLLLSLIEEARTKWGYSSKDIFVCTYSNALAAELKNKVGNRARAGTLHSFGFKLLKSRYKELGFRWVPVLVKDFEVSDLFHTLAKKNLSQKNAKVFHREYLRKGKSLKRAAQVSKIPYDIAKKVLQQFRLKKRQQNIVTFSDMVWYANKIFVKNTEAISKLELPKVFLLDEYQDLNSSEKRLAGFLINHAETSVIVGDDRQAIYCFKGAEQGALKRLSKKIPKCQYLTWDVSRRLSRQTAAFVNACLNQQNYPEIRSEVTGEKPVLFWGTSRENTYWAVAKEIQKLVIEESVDLQEIAVLARLRKHTKQISHFLVQLGIPISTSSITDEEIAILNKFKDFAEAILDENNEMFSNYLLKYGKLSQYQAKKISLHPASTINRKKLKLIGSQGSWARRVSNCLLGCRKSLKPNNLRSDLRLKKVFRLFTAVLQGKIDGFTNQNIIHILDRYDIYPLNEITLDLILKRVSLFLENLEKPQKEGVYLGTIHGSKGGDWEHVFLTDIHDENIFKNPVLKANENEESNIFHVGLTRSKVRLYLAFFLERVFIPKFKSEKKEEVNEDQDLVWWWSEEKIQKGKGRAKKLKARRNSMLRFLPKEHLFKDLCEIREVWVRD